MSYATTYNKNVNSSFSTSSNLSKITPISQKQNYEQNYITQLNSPVSSINGAKKLDYKEQGEGSTQNNKIKEMSNDLARLKDQLGKIMSQADKYEKNNKTYQSTNNANIQPDKEISNKQTPYLKQKSDFQQNNINLQKLPYQRQTDAINFSNNVKLESNANGLQQSNSNNSFNLKSLNRGENRTVLPQYRSNNSLKQFYHRQDVQQDYTNMDKLNFSLKNITAANQQQIKEISSANTSNNPISYKGSLNNQQFYRPNLKIKNQREIPTTQYSKDNQIKSLPNNYQITNSNSFKKGQDKIQYADQFKVNKETHQVFAPIKNLNGPKVQFKNSPLIQVQNSQKAYNFQTKINDSQKIQLQLPNYSSTQLSKKKSQQQRNSQRVYNKIINDQLTRKYTQFERQTDFKNQIKDIEFRHQQKIIQLQYKNRNLQSQIVNLTLQNKNLESRLQSEKNQKDKYLEKFKQVDSLHYKTKLIADQLQDKCKILQKKLQTQTQIKSNKSINSASHSFDEALKQQIDELKVCKDKLEVKDEEIMRLKESYTQFRRQIDSLNNSIKVQQLKASAMLKEAQQKYSIEVLQKQNQIKTLKNVITTLESKLSVAVNQNKSKDNFMKSHLSGRVKTQQQKQYVQNFFKNYEIEFPTNRLSEKIKQEWNQIQVLKKTIVDMVMKNK